VSEMQFIQVQQGQKPPQDLIDHIEKMNAEQARFEQGARREILRLAPILCSCRRWYDWQGDQHPPQEQCIVHHSVMITPEGEVIG
jgi:hypothetical protein